LFASGKALRGQGQILNASDTEVGNINTGLGRKTDALALGNKRLNEDLTYDEGIKRRDLNQEKYYNIETGALNETDLAQKRRELERNQYIGQPYSSGSLSNFLGSINSNI
jgi:hypothetical protein